MILVYITNKDENEARKIAKHLLEKKMIACANIFPVSSLYLSNEDLQDEKEFVLLCKTNDENYDGIKNEVRKMHSYEVPCILKISIEANKEYESWVNQNAN